MRNFRIIILILLLSFLSCKNKKSDDFNNQNAVQIESNQKVVNALLNEGDKLTKSREVFHWIYFKTEEDRKDFLKEVISKKFELVKSNKIDGEFPYQLQIKRIDKVDKKSVDEYVIYLWGEALKNNGDYDGWETSVEKN